MGIGSQIMTDPGPGSSAGNGTLGSNMGGLGMLFQQLQGQPQTASQQAMAPNKTAADPWANFGSARGFSMDPSLYEAANSSKDPGTPVRKLSLDQLNSLISSSGLQPRDLNRIAFSQGSDIAPGPPGPDGPNNSYHQYSDAAGNIADLFAPGGDTSKTHGVNFDTFRNALQDYDGQWGTQQAAPASGPTPTPLSGPVGTNFVHLNPLPYLNSMSTSPTPGSTVPNNTLTQISGSGSGAFGSLNSNPGQVDWSQWMNGAGPTGANNY